MDVTEYDAADGDAVLAAMAVLNACREHETPWLAPLTAYRHRMDVLHSWDGSPERHYLGSVDGEPVAVASLELVEYDNTDFAWVGLQVRPDRRRRGHGSALLDELARTSRERGRTKIGGSGWELPATMPFAAHHGFQLGSVEVARQQRPLELPPGLAAEALAEAAPYAEGYELVQLVGPTPPNLLPGVVALASSINDAPTDDLEVEDEVFTAERVRAYEDHTMDAGYRFYRLLVRHRDTGELAGHTVVVVDAERPELAHQHDTSVLREHRGHRLGLLLKAEMMRWLAAVEPRIEVLDTWNAESNDHMIAVNERLGYQAVARQLELQRRL